MPRKNRIDIPGILQHVIVRGIEKSKIFKDDQDKKQFIKYLSDTLLKNNGKCYGWVLMSNHLQLAIISGEQGLSKMMRELLTRYAIYFNHRHKRSGHLFQNRYKSIICDRDAYLLELVRYIHLNPIRAGIIKDINELGKFKWSGHRVVIGKEKYEWQEKDEILGCFASKEKIAIKKYQEFLKEGVGHKKDLNGGGLKRSLGDKKKEHLQKINEKQMYDDRILGSGDFVESIMRVAGIHEENKNKISKKIESIENLINIISQRMKVKIEDLKGNRKDKRIAKARALISYIGQRYMGEKGVVIGLLLNKTGASISMLYKKGEQIVAKDKEVGQLIGNILTS